MDDNQKSKSNKNIIVKKFEIKHKHSCSVLPSKQLNPTIDTSEEQKTKDDEDLEGSTDLNFTWISESKNIKNLDYTKDIEQTSDKYLYCFRNVQINYINGSKKSILMSYDSSTMKKYDLVNFN